MDRPPGNQKTFHRPRIILCGLRGGSGKTVAVTGLIGALRRRGEVVSPFKKGPDYIDPQWLSLASGRPCRNLDSFFMSRERILQSIVEYSEEKGIAVIEGNRGLYDGVNDDGTYSTAELAIALNAPIIIVVDCTKTTRTVAAMALGCKVMNPDVPIRGVILNHVATERQEEVIRAAVERDAGLPVVGSIRRMRDFSFPERHLGLYPPSECDSSPDVVNRLTQVAESGLDSEAIVRIANSAPPIVIEPDRFVTEEACSRESVRIGVIWDDAFHFYYPENLEALKNGGAEIVEIDAIDDVELPEIDALYIGGGFPEVLAERLAINAAFRESVRNRIEMGLPVLAECGGLVFLSESVCIDGRTHPMAGVFPITYRVSNRPQGHGYTVVEVDRENPFFPVGTELRGHEFRYSTATDNRHDMTQTAFRMQRGFGFDGERDGLIYKNCLASFCHHHSLGNPAWSDGMLERAREFKRNSIKQSLV